MDEDGITCSWRYPEASGVSDARIGSIHARVRSHGGRVRLLEGLEAERATARGRP